MADPAMLGVLCEDVGRDATPGPGEPAGWSVDSARGAYMILGPFPTREAAEAGARRIRTPTVLVPLFRERAQAPVVTKEMLRLELCRQVAEAGSQQAWASAHRVPVRMVGMAVHRVRDMTPAIINALGYMIVECYVPIARGAA